jgi:hypothetical protein
MSLFVLGCLCSPIVHGNVQIYKWNEEAVTFDTFKNLAHPAPIIDVHWMDEPYSSWLLCLTETGAIVWWDMTLVCAYLLLLQPGVCYEMC